MLDVLNYSALRQDVVGLVYRDVAEKGCAL